MKREHKRKRCAGQPHPRRGGCGIKLFSRSGHVNSAMHRTRDSAKLVACAAGRYGKRSRRPAPNPAKIWLPADPRKQGADRICSSGRFFHSARYSRRSSKAWNSRVQRGYRSILSRLTLFQNVAESALKNEFGSHSGSNAVLTKCAMQSQVRSHHLQEIPRSPANWRALGPNRRS